MLVWVSSAFAAEVSPAVIHPSISLSSLKAIKTQESNGDELYLTVTEYPSVGQSSHKQFPQYPEYWPSAKLSQVSNVPLWNKELKSGESVILIISLIEQDVPPFNPDDLIGTVRVTMKNNNGKLESSWVVQDEKTKPVQLAKTVDMAKLGGSTSGAQPHQVEFMASDGHYVVNFVQN